MKRKYPLKCTVVVLPFAVCACSLSLNQLKEDEEEEENIPQDGECREGLEDSHGASHKDNYFRSRQRRIKERVSKNTQDRKKVGHKKKSDSLIGSFFFSFSCGSCFVAHVVGSFNGFLDNERNE